MYLISVSKTDTDSEWTDTDTIFSNYPGYTDIRLRRIFVQNMVKLPSKLLFL